MALRRVNAAADIANDVVRLERRGQRRRRRERGARGVKARSVVEDRGGIVPMTGTAAVPVMVMRVRGEGDAGRERGGTGAEFDGESLLGRDRHEPRRDERPWRQRRQREQRPTQAAAS
jgi:hypothetical protein